MLRELASSLLTPLRYNCCAWPSFLVRSVSFPSVHLNRRLLVNSVICLVSSRLSVNPTTCATRSTKHDAHHQQHACHQSSSWTPSSRVFELVSLELQRLRWRRSHQSSSLLERSSTPLSPVRRRAWPPLYLPEPGQGPCWQNPR